MGGIEGGLDGKSYSNRSAIALGFRFRADKKPDFSLTLSLSRCGGRAVFKSVQYRHLTLLLAGGSDAVAAGEGQTEPSPRLGSTLPGGE